MKNSHRQKQAAENVALSISLATDMALESKKHLEKSVKWIYDAKNYLRKISEATSQLSKAGHTSHPMLACSAAPTFDATTKACDNVLANISDDTLKKVEQFIQNCVTNINQVNQFLKQNLEELQDLYENFVDDTHNGLGYEIRELQQSGYNAHCGYLRYANALDELEKAFMNNFQDIRDIDQRLSKFEYGFYQTMNARFVNAFPYAENCKKELKLITHDEVFAKCIKVFRTGFQGFRSPHVAPVHYVQFDSPQLEMKCTNDFTGSKVGEISVKKGEKVSAINTSLADWMKIRTSNGMEGYVPFTVLEPIPQK